MDRLNHVKIVTPDPEAVEAFLVEVLEVPAGWSLGDVTPIPDLELRTVDRDSDGAINIGSVMDFRGQADGYSGGMIVGDTVSRQFQIFQGPRAHIWGVAIGSRHLERAHERCRDQRIPCTEIRQSPWHGSSLEFFFAEVGGIVFEVLRLAEPPR
jgi:hypothetical protein